MKHVIVRWDADPGGYWLDPRPYLERLPDIAEALPPGSASYARATGHYDFGSDRCVKDLWFNSLIVNDPTAAVTANYAPNKSRHHRGLTIVYEKVVSVAISHERASGVGWLGSLLLDEVLPAPQGVSHEVVLTGGRLTIVAGDLEARWE